MNFIGVFLRRLELVGPELAFRGQALIAWMSHHEIWKHTEQTNNAYFCDSECPYSTLGDYQLITIKDIKYLSIIGRKLASRAPDVTVTWKSKTRVPSSSC